MILNLLSYFISITPSGQAFQALRGGSW